MGAVSIVFYVGLTLVSDNVLQDSILAVGILIAFYYGMTGFACAWEFRRDLHTAPRRAHAVRASRCSAGFMLLGVFVWPASSTPTADYGYTVIFGVGGVFVIGIGTLVLGAVLMFIYNAIAPAYFRGETLRQGEADLLLEPPVVDRTAVRLPDTEEETVIAPDRSNLPPGREPYEPDLTPGRASWSRAAGLRTSRGRR